MLYDQNGWNDKTILMLLGAILCLGAISAFAVWVLEQKWGMKAWILGFATGLSIMVYTDHKSVMRMPSVCQRLHGLEWIGFPDVWVACRMRGQ